MVEDLRMMMLGIDKLLWTGIELVPLVDAFGKLKTWILAQIVITNLYKKGFKILSYLKATLKVAAATTSGVKSEPSATRKADDILWNIFDFHTFIPILEFNNQKQSQNNINTSELGKCILTSQAVMLQWPRRQELTLCMLMCYVRALTVSRIMSTVSSILAFGRIPYPAFFHH